MTLPALSWADLWAEATNALSEPEDARHIVEEASGFSGASWLLSMDTVATETGAERVRDMVKRRQAGEPLQYVLGTWDFRLLRLDVDQRVLIPRPETEQVVQAAIEAVEGRSQVVALDLGTGSGAIALSLARELENAHVFAVDLSQEALDVAAANAEKLGLVVRWYFGSWYEPLPQELMGHVDLIVSNPPYVANGSEVEAVVVDNEPHSALFAGEDGLDSIRQVIAGARDWLKPDGHLIVEMAPEQAPMVAQLSKTAGFGTVSFGTDLAERLRWFHATVAS